MSVRVRLTGTEAECVRLAALLTERLEWPTAQVTEVSGWRASRSARLSELERRHVGRMAVTVMLAMPEDQS